MAKATYENELITAARNVSRLQRKIAQHKKAIKSLALELKRERVILRHLAGRAQSVPSKLFGPGVGLAAPDSMKPSVDPTPAAVEDITTGFEEPAKYTGRSTRREH
jgi:hypothetical protein